MNIDYYSMRDNSAPTYPSKNDYKNYQIFDIDTMEPISNPEEHKITKEYAESVIGKRIYGDEKVFSNDKFIVKVIFNEEDYKKDLEEYKTETNQRMDEFKKELFNLYGSDNQELNELVYDKAWQDGHSGGLGEVESEFQELMDFAENIFDLSNS
tara:strand:- start:3080 stop:3541 length:462 start_codon:yes stop_codon:yes gene_type:complete